MFLPDLRYNGELKTISGWYRPYGTLFGRYEATVAAHDLRQIAAAIAAASGEFRADELVVIGFGHGVVPALIAGALEPAVRACAAAEIGPTYREGRTTPLFDNAIGLGDLPRLAVLVAGRPLYLDGMSDPDLYDGAKEYSRVLGPAAVIASTPDAPGHARLLEWYTGLFQTPLPPGTGKTLSIGDATSVQGASFTLSTYLSGARDETQFGFSATFDAGRLTFLHVSAPDTAVQDWDQVSSTPEGAGTVRIEAAAGSGTPATGEVRLIDLVFTAMADAPLGDTVVQPVSAGFSGGIAGATGVPGIVHILPAPTPTSTPTATPTPSRTPTPTPLPPAGFDLNQNGPVEAGDLLILIENYGTSGPLGDFNGDGRVDEMDVLLFSVHWDLSA
ncbi:hypothetical protein HS125_09335 [bacterium]|nr:hypothetical protein [bacterium]